jgi:uridine kinase
MTDSSLLSTTAAFSEALFLKLKLISPAMEELELYEVRYCLENLNPVDGWRSVKLDPISEIEERLNSYNYYKGIQINQRVNGNIVLDHQILNLTQMLMVGFVTGQYQLDWINTNFYFDVRSFLFYHRTNYFTDKVLAHFGEKPFMQFEKKQKDFEWVQAVGYKEFKKANREVDECFIQSVKKLIEYKKTPILLAVAGPTAAGKTEIVERLYDAFSQAGQQVTSIELDNFLSDRDYREAHGIDSEGKQALHFELLKQALADITQGKKISIPRYDFVNATSSHDVSGKLKLGGVPIEIEPADIIFMEGNFPFLLEEIVELIGIKVVYLTDDPIRLKRKWKRDMDYRKKYPVNYFRNRYFKDQFIMAQIAYLPQLEVCDLCVDTTQAAIWAKPEIVDVLRNR